MWQSVPRSLDVLVFSNSVRFQFWREVKSGLQCLEPVGPLGARAGMLTLVLKRPTFKTIQMDLTLWKSTRVGTFYNILRWIKLLRPSWLFCHRGAHWIIIPSGGKRWCIICRGLIHACNKWDDGGDTVQKQILMKVFQKFHNTWGYI